MTRQTCTAKYLVSRLRVTRVAAEAGSLHPLPLASEPSEQSDQRVWRIRWNTTEVLEYLSAEALPIPDHPV